MRQNDVHKQLFLDSGGETVLISLNPVVYELNENVGKFQRVVSCTRLGERDELTTKTIQFHQCQDASQLQLEHTQQQ